MKKAKSYKRHVDARALERIGYVLSDETLDDFKRQIGRGDGFFMERESIRVSKWLVRHDTSRTLVPVVYDKSRHSIVTILPLDCAEATRYLAKFGSVE